MNKVGVKSRYERERMRKEAEYRQVVDITQQAIILRAKCRNLAAEMDELYRSMEFTNFEYSKEIQRLIHKTRFRMFFNRHFYPEYMVQEMIYVVEELKQVSAFLSERYTEFLNEHEQNTTKI